MARSSTFAKQKQVTPTRVVIVGGGAAGLFCAAQLPEEMEVHILERLETVGRKVLVTGNGRCNLSNTGANTGGYNGDAAFASTVLKEASVEETMALFFALGLDVVADDAGRFYPTSHQAKSVVNVLTRTCEKKNVTFHADCTVTDIESPVGSHPYLLQTTQGTIEAEIVILATGGHCERTPGFSTTGYALAEQLGHKIVPQFPAIVQLITEEPDKAQLKAKGSRAVGKISIELDGVCVASSSGEILFTEYGLSGICTMEVSRYVSEFISQGKAGSMVAVLDLMPWRTEQELKKRLERLIRQGVSRRSVLDGFLPLSISRMIAHKAGSSTDTMAKLTKEWRMTLTGTKNYDFAQITCGGIDTREISPVTMQSKKHENLYLLGEMLNVDGSCGGYNLQFAWSTALLAAKKIIENETNND